MSITVTFRQPTPPQLTGLYEMHMENKTTGRQFRLEHRALVVTGFRDTSERVT